MRVSNAKRRLRLPLSLSLGDCRGDWRESIRGNGMTQESASVSQFPIQRKKMEESRYLGT